MILTTTMPGYLDQTLSRRSFVGRSLTAGAMLALAQSRIALAAGSEPSLHLALFSDTHVSGDRDNEYRGFKPWDNLTKLIPEVVAARPEGAIICGDAARLAGLPADYQVLKELLAPLAAVAPIHIGLGNHDHRDNFFKTFDKPPGSVPGVGGKHVALIDHPAVRVLILDSLLYVDKVAGLLGQRQRGWLGNFLGDSDARPVVLFIHHTLGDGDGDLLDADRLFKVLDGSSKVKAIFYGHSHVWRRSERQGIDLINLPAVGYNFSDREPLGWVDARFSASGADLKLHAIAGNTKADGEEIKLDWSE